MSRVLSPARYAGLTAAAAAALFAAACSDSGSPTAPSTVAGSASSTSASPLSAEAQGPSFSKSPELNTPSGVVHLFRTLPWHVNQRARHAAGTTGSVYPIQFHGGPVLQAATRVAAIYWSSTPIYKNAPAVGTYGAGSSDASLLGFFLGHLGGSPYFNINTTYTDAYGRHVLNSVTYTQYWANGTNAPSGNVSVSDAQMQSMLAAGFASGALKYDASTIYTIFTPGQVNLGGGFGTQYCAYHTAAYITVAGVRRPVLYAAMPYNNTYPGTCTSGALAANGSLDPGADYEVNTLAHEIEETTTDMYGNAWYDAQGYENGDKCAWTWGSVYVSQAGGYANMRIGGRDFLVQQNWLATGGCALSY